MIRLIVALSLVAVAAPAFAQPRKGDPSQKEADKHFKSGVALYKEAKYNEALAEFERAYELQPHPLVLYNIATCHRELSQYSEAVKFYKKFLTEAANKAPPARLHTAQTELDSILARVASVTIAVPDGTELVLDGKALGAMPLEMPLILAPGEHHITARAAGKKDVERKLKVASGDEVSIQLDLPDAPKEVATTTNDTTEVTETATPAAATATPKRLALGVGYGTNLGDVANTGAGSLGVGYVVTDRIQVGVDVTFVALAVMPAVRVRLAGDALSVHVVGAVPIARSGGEMSETFVAGAGGLGLRYRAMPMLSFRLESFASYAGKDRGTTFPTFLGGELWF
jgi:hypothetical protein